MKKTTKPAAKAATKPVTKRPRTYKKADLPRTARAYLGKKYNVHIDKENEAVAKLIELHDHEARKALTFEPAPMQREGEAISYGDLKPFKKLTLREQFLAWIGAK